MLDNERCILCSRCVRFTHEVSKSHALGVAAARRPFAGARGRGRRFDADPYSDNVVDICPVGALLSRPFLHKSRVWYLKPTPSVCPGCERGCTIDIWHRKPRVEAASARPAPERAHRPRDAAREPGRERPVDLQQGARPGADLRAPARDAGDAARRAGRPDRARSQARALIVRRGGRSRWSRAGAPTKSSRPSTQCSAALRPLRQGRLAPQPGERDRGRLLIRADKNPEPRRRAALFPRAGRRPRAARTTPTCCWSGARASTSRELPRGATLIVLDA